jgi:WS/DGAT/MGAT family acyltransferase
MNRSFEVLLVRGNHRQIRALEGDDKKGGEHLKCHLQFQSGQELRSPGVLGPGTTLSYPVTVAAGSDGAGRPLEDEDLAILALESVTIVGHVCKVIVTSGSLARDRVVDRLRRRLPLAPLLTCRLDSPDAGRRWVPDESFDLDRHVSTVRPLGPLDRRGLLEMVAVVFEEHLDRTRPLWHITTVDLDDGGTALVWRIHHALADGTAANRLADLLLWDDPRIGEGRLGDAPAVMTPELAAAHRADDIRRRLHLAGFLRREFGRQPGPSPFDGTIGRRREMAVASAPLADLHHAAHEEGATVNDALLAVVAGALRQWLEVQHGRVEDLRARVPVSMHHEGDDASNRDSCFFVSLPLHEEDPLERLRLVRRQTVVRKEARDAQELHQLHRELAAVPQLRDLVERIECSPRRFAVCISNVPGPRQPVALLEQPVVELFGFAEVGEQHALRVTANSNADQLSLGFCADPALVPGVEAMAAAAEAEVTSLIAAVGGPAPPAPEPPTPR